MSGQQQLQQQQQQQQSGSQLAENESTGGTSQPQLGSQNRPQSTLLLETGEGDYFVDGIQYSATSGDSGSYLPELFTCDDIYTVMDTNSSSSATVTEIEDATVWSGANYIPLGEATDRRNLPGGEVSGGNSSDTNGMGSLGYSNGSFFRLLLHSDQAHAQAALAAANFGCDAAAGNRNSGESGSAGEDKLSGSYSESNGDPLMDVTSSPAAGLAISIQDLTGAGQQAKIRKPRGRKPKHVKEAEAAAAAAAAAAANIQAASLVLNGTAMTPGTTLTLANGVNSGDTGVNETTPPGVANGQPRQGASQRTGTAEDVSPNVVIHHPANHQTPQQQQSLQMGGGFGRGIMQGGPPQQQQQPPPPQKQFSQQQQGLSGKRQMSLEQLASHDRHMLIMSRRNNNPPTPGGIIPATYMTRQPAPTYQQVYSNHPNAGYSCRLPPGNLQNQNPGMMPAANASNSGPPPSAARSVVPPAHPHYANSTVNSAGRLDQFFSSRIPAPSNKAVLKPKLIQDNRSIYDLLTTPTSNSGPASPGFENRKLQERWMQCPNPSALQDDNDRSNGNMEGGSMNGFNTPGGNNPPNMTPHRRMDYSANSSAPPNVTLDQSSRYVLGNIQGRVNIRRDAETPSAPAMDGGGRSYQSSQTRSSSNNYHRNGNGQYFYVAQMQEMQQRLDHLTTENYELRCRSGYLNKMNKTLMARLRISYEQNEGLKAYLHQTGQGGFGPLLLGGSGSFGYDDAFMMMGYNGGGHSNGGPGSTPEDSYFDGTPHSGGLPRIIRAGGGGGGGGNPENDLSWRSKKMDQSSDLDSVGASLNTDDGASTTVMDTPGSSEGGTTVDGGSVRPDLKRSLPSPESSDSSPTTKKACSSLTEEISGVSDSEVSPPVEEGGEGEELKRSAEKGEELSWQD